MTAMHIGTPRCARL